MPQISDSPDPRPLAESIEALSKVLGLSVPFDPRPDSEAGGGSNGSSNGSGKKYLGPIECSDYKTLVNQWKKALKWRASMDEVLSIMLAVALSTDQIGDQLFLMVIGDAGSGKTRLCDGMLTSRKCHALEHLTGFHSGWKDDSDEDFSLLARINHKTLITPEGDVLISSPHFQEIMSQQRRIFDGSSGASYKNRKEDRNYSGLRTPWIIAGTPALLDTDQSRLGDRFLKVFVDPPTEEEKAEILRKVSFTALRSVKATSNGSPEHQVDEALCRAYQLTGGYVDWLSENTHLLADIECSEESLMHCAYLAEFAAEIRARPSQGKLEVHDTKELPTRLTHQFVRLACCLTVVLNKKAVDEEVLARVRKVALDTCRGSTLTIVSSLYQYGSEGLTTEAIANELGRVKDRNFILLRFLKAIGTIESFTSEAKGRKGRICYRLTPRVFDLYRNAMPSTNGSI